MTLCRLAFVAAATTLAISFARADERVTTENFEVSAPTRQLAEEFARRAEEFRKEKAEVWLGKEMPRWAKRCPLVVVVNPTKTGGATTFSFSRNGVAKQEMEIFGKVDQMLESVLPHEVTHTVLAHHFGRPVPRWADEGGSVLSENDAERLEHDIKCREFLNANRGIPLRSLFPMEKYPKDTIVLYAQGFSVSNYLINLGGGDLKGRQKFLDFLETGMAKGNDNWNAAVKQHYGYANVDDLQEQWIDSLRTPPVAKGKEADKLRREAVATSKGSRSETRSTATLGVPQLEPPVINTLRASAPDPLPPIGSPLPAASNKLPPARPELLAPVIPVGK